MKTLREFNDAGFKLIQSNIAKWTIVNYTLEDVEKLTVDDIKNDNYYLKNYSFESDGDEDVRCFKIIPPKYAENLEEIEINLDNFLDVLEKSNTLEELILKVYEI